MVLGYADKKFLRLLDELKAKRTWIGKSKVTSGNCYRITITRSKKQIRFYYHDNFRNAGDISDWLNAIILDNDCYEQSRSWYDFTREFYPDYIGDIKMESKAREIYYGCKRNGEKLHKLFTDDEIQLMRENIE